MLVIEGSDSAPTVEATLPKITPVKIDGQTNATLDTDGLDDGNYFCTVSWEVSQSGTSGYYTLTSASVEHTAMYYTITFDANGGSATMAAITVEAGDYTLPACGFTAPTGKQFKAWSVNGQEYAVGDIITVDTPLTITALWETVVIEYPDIPPYIPFPTPEPEEAPTTEEEEPVEEIVLDISYQGLRFREVKAGKNFLKMNWDSMEGADGYVIYGVTVRIR